MQFKRARPIKITCPKSNLLNRKCNNCISHYVKSGNLPQVFCCAVLSSWLIMSTDYTLHTLLIGCTWGSQFRTTSCRPCHVDHQGVAIYPSLMMGHFAAGGGEGWGKRSTQNLPHLPQLLSDRLEDFDRSHPSRLMLECRYKWVGANSKLPPLAMSACEMRWRTCISLRFISAESLFRRICIVHGLLNPLMTNQYKCAYVLFLFLRSNCCKKLTLTLLIRISPKQTIVILKINY